MLNNPTLQSIEDDWGAQSYLSVMHGIHLPLVDKGWLDQLPPDKRQIADKVLSEKPYRLLTYKKGTPGHRASEENERAREKWAKKRAAELDMPVYEFHRTRESTRRFYESLNKWREQYNEDGTPKKSE